jgi:hypothetical protein
MKMKRLFMLLLIPVVLYSCKDDGIHASSLTSFNITNAVNGGGTLTLNNNGADIGNFSFSQTTLFAGQTGVKLGDTSQHPQEVYYNQSTTTTNGSYYSLFLSGTDPQHVDNVLIKESYQNYTDSIAGVRFINLSTGSNPISVDIQGKANGSEVQSLAYKAYTTFQKYPASPTTPTQYNFEFRDAQTGTLLATYTLSAPAYHNVTLVFARLPGSQTVFQDNEY